MGSKSPNGYVAYWRGEQYQASPGWDGSIRLYSPAALPGWERVGPERYRAVVPPDQVEEFCYVRTVGIWRGIRVAVIGEYGDWLRVEYLGQSADEAEQLGLEHFDLYVYQGWAPRAEITEVVEQRI